MIRNVFQGHIPVESEILVQFAHYQMEELKALTLSKRTKDKKKYHKLLKQAKEYDKLQLNLIKQYLEEVSYQLPIEMTMFLEKKYFKNL